MKKKVSGTKEWAEHSANFMKGCPSCCKYCYQSANEIGRWKRVKLGEWGNPVFMEKSFNRKWGKKEGAIMFPTTHDIYPEILDKSIDFLKRILEPGNKVLIVSKPHYDCVYELCDKLWEYKDQILFRFTIGSCHDSTLKYWEPNAPNFLERFKSLKLAFNLGFKTSVSCEPILDKDIRMLIEGYLKPFITDAIWLGKMNQIEKRLKANGIKNIPAEIMSGIDHWENDDNIWTLYYRYKEDPKIKWKESIKKIVGIKEPEKIGMDI